MSDEELIKTARQAMADLWYYNDGKFLDYEQSAYNCLRLLCLRLESLSKESPVSEIDYKRLVNALYPKDNSKIFRP